MAKFKVTGTYKRKQRSVGADGGSEGGSGATAAGTILLTAGDVLQILVGGDGGFTNGGGGRFVVFDDGAIAADDALCLLYTSPSPRDRG